MKYITGQQKVNPLRESWVNLLSKYRFTWFATLTFKDLPKTYTAINRFNRFIRAIERAELREVGYYVALEKTLQGANHFHVLMGNLQGVRRDKWWKWWYTKYGRARIEPYMYSRGAPYYLTKYTTKSMSWYDIKNLHKLNMYNQLRLDL